MHDCSCRNKNWSHLGFPNRFGVKLYTFHSVYSTILVHAISQQFNSNIMHATNDDRPYILYTAYDTENKSTNDDDGHL